MSGATQTDGHPAADALIRVRRERVHTTMLIELLVLLVFLAMAFAFVKESETRMDPVQERLKRLEAQLRERDRQIAQLRTENRELRQINASLGESLRRFIRDHRGTLRANDALVILPHGRFAELTGKLAEQQDILDQRQRELAIAQRKLTAQGKGGSNLPLCPVAAGQYIVVIEADGNRFRATPAWRATADGAVAQVPGLRELASGRYLSAGEFLRLGMQVRRWGEAQPTPCRFSARLRNKAMAQRQWSVVQQPFYLAW